MIRGLIVFAFVTAYMILASMVAYPLAWLFDSPALLYAVGRLGLRMALFLAGTRVVLEGAEHLEDTKNAIIMANHVSLLDPVIIVQILKADIKAVAKTEIFRIPFFHRCLRFAGFIEVDRSNREQATKAIRSAVESLKAGNCFLIFPEGTRSRTGSLGDFKKGGFVVALDAGSRIIPVALKGVRELMPRGGLRIRPGIVRVKVLDPVDAGRYSYEDKDRLIAQVRGSIAAALAP
jgi:1-acyl-sn-glycerol-3-phosphate acyltransferase